MPVKAMTRALVAVAAAGAFAAAGVTYAAAGDAEHDSLFASGSGKITYPDVPTPGAVTEDHFSFTAHLRRDGSVSGSIVIESSQPPELPKADATCLIVVGNTARVGGVLRGGPVALPPPFEHLTVYAVGLVLTDNGAPGHAEDMADAYLFLSRPGRDEQTPCTFPVPAASRPVEHGNVNIGGMQGVRARIVG